MAQNKKNTAPKKSAAKTKKAPVITLTGRVAGSPGTVGQSGMSQAEGNTMANLSARGNFHYRDTKRTVANLTKFGFVGKDGKITDKGIKACTAYAAAVKGLQMRAQKSLDKANDLANTLANIAAS